MAAFFPVHPTVLPQRLEVFSSDLFGVAARLLEEQSSCPNTLASDSVVAFFNGAEGGSLKIWVQGFKHIFYFQQNNGEYLGRSIAMLINERLPKADRPTTAAIVGAEDNIANSITAGPAIFCTSPSASELSVSQ